MKVFVVLCCVIASCFALPTHMDYEWDAWKTKYGKLYYDEREEAVRRFIWEKNLGFVDRHNKEASMGDHSYTLEMNRFADLEAEEFAKLFLGVSRKGPRATPSCTPSSLNVISHNYVNVPTTVNWTSKGYVTGVKDQGQCGSCWAFSTTGSVEGQHFKATGKLVSLSEQNLMDCSKPEGDFSCEGGMMDYAFEYIIDNGGIDTEQSYPYLAMDEQTCKFNKSNVGATISGCVDITSGDETQLKKAVATVGPISVAIDASQLTFQLYKEGVYDEPMCSTTVLDHGVLVVGYGSDGGHDYWLVKNSWGLKWGMQGYIMMSRNRGNQCGIATNASYPTV